MRTPCVEINDIPYHGYVYMWCDKKRNKYYIGSHGGSVYDSYKCGSKMVKNVIDKRPHTTDMIVLEYYYGECRKELYTLEERWLKFYDVQNNRNFYNFKNQARGGVGAFKHKGKMRSEYTPNWADNRKGKTIDEIYKDPEKQRARLSKTMTDYYDKHGHGVKYGKKHKSDSRRGKTVEEIYGYRRVVNPNKPFIITIQEKNKPPYEVLCLNEKEFHEKTNLEDSSLRRLKNNGEKTIQRILPSTRHQYTKGTILKFKFVEHKD